MKPVTKGPDRSSHRRLRPLRRLGLALALGAVALDADAAGLGRLNLLSGIGQPLRAEIEITAVSRDEAAALNARLASPDAFGQAGIEYGSALSNLRFSIQRRPGGQPYVLVTSNALVNDPYLDVLVELSWSSGRLVREYTMLLDPPETRAARTEVAPGQTIVQAQSPATPRVATGPTAAPATPATSSRDATAAAPGLARAPTSASAAAGTYVVQNGDTALSIARANKPDGVSLEQMLAVLYRDNRQAFGSNINRLMAGASVTLPDAATAQAVDGPEARRIVAQSANFGRYRERLAENAASAPAARTDGQQASDRLTTQVQDNAAPPTDAGDRLKLSRPDAARQSAGQAGARRGPAGPTAEELVAKDRELTESRARLAQLEKNVADLQQLLKLKNETLASLQKGTDKSAETAVPAPAPTAPAPAVPAPPAASVAPPPAPPAAAATAPAATPALPTTPAPTTPAPTTPAPTPTPAPTTAAAPTTPPAPTTPTTPAPATTPATPPIAKAAPAPIGDSSTSDGTWYDALLDNTLLLIGLLVVAVLLVGYGLLTMRRRRKLASFEDSIFVDNSVLHANSVFGTTGGQSVDTANSGFHSNFVPVAGSLPQQSEVDPVAEADVYIAYGRDAQAEEILKEALRGDGTRQAVRLKLLEIYARRGDTKSFETTASELYAATGGVGADWAQAATLGASIDPRNPLYGETGTAGSSAPTAAPATAVGPSASDRATAIAAAAGAFAFSDIGVGASEQPPGVAPVDHTRTDPLPRAPAPPAASPPSMDLDFDLGLGDGAAPSHETKAAPEAPPPAHADDAFDFDASESSKPLVDPFTASAFGGDSSTRTAVNLPAFRARADQPAPNERPAAPPTPTDTDNEGFSASDIFGSSIVADSLPYSAIPHDAPAGSSTPEPDHDPHAHAFERTEPLDAFHKINLDLDDDSFGSAHGSDAVARTDVWQAMATKLDLALAYSDIGDKDGARELLEEVVRNGDEAQSDRARTLIGQLD